MPPKTMYEKIWDAHVISEKPGKPALLYIDLHLLHEVSSPQGFEGLRLAGRTVHRPDLTIATVDHNVPTKERSLPIADETARRQVDLLGKNTSEFGITFYGLHSPGQGIVHVIGPEQGYSQPGATIVCGDSHTSTHGAFGALAFGIGASEVEHVLATQCLLQRRSKTMEVQVNAPLPRGVTAKDLILAIIGRIGVDGAVGHVIEYTGAAFRSMSMEGRMTVCNMSIEAGARAGMIDPDETTFDYLEKRRFSPKGKEFQQAVDRWRMLPSDEGAAFDRTVTIDAASLVPYVTWGTNPGMVGPITGVIPDPESFSNEADRLAVQRALEYMGLKPGTPLKDITIDRVFIGSCTNSRLEDLRAAAGVVRDRKVAMGVKAMVVPGSALVKSQAEREGLDVIFIEAGFEWRDAGCSMCVAMNDDTLGPGERCAATSNRNFEGRQGKDSRTHLVSPSMAAAAAITGHLTDVRGFYSV